MNLFERYLTLWVALCIAVGIGNIDMFDRVDVTDRTATGPEQGFPSGVFGRQEAPVVPGRQQIYAVK